MNRHLGVVVCAVVLATGVFASCSESSKDKATGDQTTDTVAAPADGSPDVLTRDEFIQKVTTGDGAISVDQANCIYDGIEEAGIKLDNAAEPADADKAKASEIAGKCFATANGVDPSQVPSLDSSTTTSP